jgi:DNA-binding SARP family transcriptional activator
VVHCLRSVIEPFREERRWIYICNQGEFYYFNMESPHWIDLYTFRRHEASAARAERSGQHHEAIMDLEEGLALYRGDLFEDDPYADWCAPERTDLRHRYLDMLLRLAELWFAVGQTERGADCLRRGLLKDPLREDFHQALIQTLMDLGRRREALDQYQECVRLLREELGAEPLPATRRLGRFLVP